MNFLFDRHREGVVRYGCMAHVRRKFVEALHADSRSAKVVQLISELYWIEFSFRVGTCFREAKAFYTDFAATLFTKAVRYAVHEWEAVCRYVNNG